MTRRSFPSGKTASPSSWAQTAAAQKDLKPEELAKIPKMPGSLREALDELQADHGFLLKGDVFTEDVIQYWIDYKTVQEIDTVNSRPAPHEFYLYFDA